MDAKSAQLVERIDAILPGFRIDCLSGDENMHLGEDGSITVHGVWSFCSGWIRDRLAGMTRAQTRALAELLNSQVGGDDGDLDNAAATCFLENLAGDPGTDRLRKMLRAEAARYWDRWSGKA